MSDGFSSGVTGYPDEGSGSGSGKVDAAKQEAAEVKDTAVDAAKNVAQTAKDEAVSVVGEAKSQIGDLYAQGRAQLGEQASQQQARIASGLASVGDELGSMARNSDGGVGADLVRQVSTRLSDAAAWLDDRDPQSVLDDVKRFARRRPVVFILGAAVVGLAAGRLVRALAANKSDESSAPGTASVTPPPPALSAQEAADVGSSFAAPTGAYPGAADGPVYAETSTRWDDAARKDADERPDAF